MKTAPIILLMLSFAFLLYGQNNPLPRKQKNTFLNEQLVSKKDGTNINARNSYSANKAVLDVNNIVNTFYSNGIHADAEEPNNGFKDESTGNYLSTFHSSGLWINGFSDGKMHLSTAFYSSVFKGGLVGTNHAFYEQVWPVYRSEITKYREAFNQGISKEEIPHNILQYPAKGNPFATDADGNPFVIEKALAPFVDRNNDNIYNPLDGDFPLIKGDQMLFWVMHDDTPHATSEVTGLKVNIFCKAYAYHRPALPTVNNTVFVEMEIVNESGVDFTDVNLGLFSDLDIGCYYDDYIGAYPEGNFFYAHNQEDMDLGCEDSDAFGDKLPVQTVLFLDKKMDKFQYFLGQGSSVPSNGLFDPRYPIEYYNLLSGTFTDGTPLTVGRYGYNPSDSINFTNYAFPGNPADATAWTLCREDLSNLDVRGLGISGPHDLAAGEKLTFAVAHTFFEDVPHPCPDIAPIATALKTLEGFYQTGYYGNAPLLTSTIAPSKQEEETEPVSSTNKIRQNSIAPTLKIYPVPASDFLQVTLENSEYSGKVTYRMLNNLGQVVFHKTTKLESRQTDSFSVDVSHLEAGVYTFYSLQAGNIAYLKKVLIF